jgi:Patatin-like phospholipase
MPNPAWLRLLSPHPGAMAFGLLHPAWTEGPKRGRPGRHPVPFGSEGVQPGIGLALSGGGFRATLFHCGALCRLDELGVLSRVDRISSVSGGSITAGLLAVRRKALRFHGDVAPNLRELVVEPLQAFCHRSTDTPAIGLRVLPLFRARQAWGQPDGAHSRGRRLRPRRAQERPSGPCRAWSGRRGSTGRHRVDALRHGARASTRQRLEVLSERATDTIGRGRACRRADRDRIARRRS